MTVVVTARVPDDLGAWASEYAERREVPRAVIVEAGLAHFRELCESGVPDLPERRGQGRPKAEESPKRQQAARVLAEVQRPSTRPEPDFAAIDARLAATVARQKAERERKHRERGW